VVRQADEREQRAERTGSDVEWDAIDPDDPIVPARLAKWVFRYEDDGERIKR
jgi:hypothetical protein